MNLPSCPQTDCVFHCGWVHAVLIVLGLMSLILTVTQRPISKICIPSKVADTMLPCHQSPEIKTTRALGYHEQFLWTDSLRERRLASDEPVSATSNDHCGSKVKFSFFNLI